MYSNCKVIIDSEIKLISSSLDFLSGTISHEMKRCNYGIGNVIPTLENAKVGILLNVLFYDLWNKTFWPMV